jgi:hypothetical protein
MPVNMGNGPHRDNGEGLVACKGYLPLTHWSRDRGHCVSRWLTMLSHKRCGSPAGEAKAYPCGSVPVRKSLPEATAYELARGGNTTW